MPNLRYDEPRIRWGSLAALEMRVSPAVFTVTNIDDDGPGSLRQAVFDANNKNGADSIVFDSSFFNTARTISLLSGPLTVQGPVSVLGPGMDLLTITANSSGRHWTIEGAGLLTVSLAGITMVDGNVPGIGEKFAGGAVYSNGEHLVIEQCRFTGNKSATDGGAIGLVGTSGSLQITDSIFINNFADSDGGAVYAISSQKMVLERCQFIGNTSDYSGGAVALRGDNGTQYPNVPAIIADCHFENNSTRVSGGAVSHSTSYLYLTNSTFFKNFSEANGGGLATGATAFVTNCRFAQNTADDDGGGIAASSFLSLTDCAVINNVAAKGTAGGLLCSGSAIIRNTTFSGNTALDTSSDTAGAIAFTFPSGDILLESCTVTNNHGGNLGNGFSTGGISLNWPTSADRYTITLRNTIVFGNTSKGVAQDCQSHFPLYMDHSLVGTIGSTNIHPASLSYFPLGTNPQLGPLTNNGGLLETHALLATSPVIDQGTNITNQLFDQRGEGFSRVSGAAPDLGAWEFVHQQPSGTTAPGDILVPSVGPGIVTVAYCDDIGIDPLTIGSGDIEIVGARGYSVTPSLTKITVGLAGSLLCTYEFAAPGGTWDSSDAGGYAISVRANQVADMMGNFVAPRLLGRLRAYAPESANNFSVWSTADNGPGTLREALELSDLNQVSVDTVTFDPLVFGVPRTITLSTGWLSAAGAIDIQGPGADLLTITTNSKHRLLTLTPGSAHAVTISGLRFWAGNQTVPTLIGVGSIFYAGGAIRNTNDHLTIQDCVFADNTSLDSGGAIFSNDGGKLTCMRCTFEDNVSSLLGGGVFNSGPSSFVDCQWIGNSGTWGGGLANLYTPSAPNKIHPVTVSGCLFFGNSAVTNRGGGIYADRTDLTVRNCTFVANYAKHANGRGGGLNIDSGTLTLDNSTLTANESNRGGGLYFSGLNDFGPSGCKITSTIVYGNFGTFGPDLAGPTSTIYTTQYQLLTNCALGNATGFLLDPLSQNNLSFGANPLIAGLADNGGTSKTVALMPDSPCINAGANPATLTSDQRGDGYYRVIGKTTDIGAYEYQDLPAVVHRVSINSGAIQRSQVTQLTVTFDRPITFAPADFQLTRQSDNAAVALGAVANGPDVTLSFLDGAVNGKSLADGRYTLAMLAAAINGGAFDGNGDMQAGDNYALVGGPANGLFRLFGDVDGDASVSAADFAAFRLEYGSNASSAFDFDGDDQVTASDFNAFRIRFGIVV